MMKLCDLSGVANDRLMAADEKVQTHSVRLAELEGRRLHGHRAGGPRC